MAVVRDAASPERLRFIELRYTNQLRLKPPAERPASLEDYLRTLPDLSRDLPEASIAGYTLQLQLPQRDVHAEATLSQALLPADGPDEVSIGLDLWLRRTEELPAADDEAALWRVVEELHSREKRMFEASITSRTRESFQEGPPR